MPLVFQYGSNCDEERLNGAKRLNGAATDLGRVRTVEAYEIAFNKVTQGGFAAADLVKQRKRGRRIWGVLYEVSKGGFEKLKQIEGPSYRPQAIVVEDVKGLRKIAKTFRVRRDKRQKYLWTSAEYVGHIVNGLRDHRVPAEYVRYVIDVATETNRRAGHPPAEEQTRLIKLLRRNPKSVAKRRKEAAAKKVSV